MIRATLIGPSEPPPSGELRLTAEIESDAGVQVNLSLPPGATLVEGLAEQILVPSSSTQASLEYTVRLAGPLQGPIRLRAASQDGAIERSYPAALVVQAAVPPKTSALTVASLLIGAASLSVGIASLLQHRKTRDRLHQTQAAISQVEWNNRKDLAKLDADLTDVDNGLRDLQQQGGRLGRYEKTLVRLARKDRKRRAGRKAAAGQALEEKLAEALGEGTGEG